MKKEDRTTSMLRYDMCKFIASHYQYFCTNIMYNRNKCVSAGEVVAIVEEPQTGENKA